MNFEIKLPLFEGPFDLLLFFIERDELNIYDIPIARITDDFLAYLHQMEVMNIEVASDFIVVAATLMKIKVKMLLPKPIVAHNEDDPRNEIVNALLEYQKYQSVLEEWGELEAIELKKEQRGSIDTDLKKVAQEYALELDLNRVDLFQLLRVYEKVIDRYVEKNNKVVHTILPYPYSVAGQKDYLRQRLKTIQNISFQALITENPLKISVIFNFLAILELLQLGEITIALEAGFNNFHISAKEEMAEPAVS
jgi:segregation and condensation protein A